MQKEIRVLVTDDHPVFRHGLASAIESDPSIKVIGKAENGKVALQIDEDESPDIIILDVDMPVMGGVETAQILKKRSSKAKTIFLTMHKDKSILKSLKSLQVKGYVLKDSAINEIVRCIKTVIAGKTYLSPKLNDLILENFDRGESASEKLPIVSTLTHAEKQVLRLITESKTNQEIAEELFVSIRTIETHRYNICLKLELNGPHALFKFAVENKKEILSLTSNRES